MPTSKEIRAMKLRRLFERMRLTRAAKRRSPKLKEFPFVMQTTSKSGQDTKTEWIKVKR